jgi:hypothetical protein
MITCFCSGNSKSSLFIFYYIRFVVLAEHLREEAILMAEDGCGFSLELQRPVLCWNLLLGK